MMPLLESSPELGTPPSQRALDLLGAGVALGLDSVPAGRAGRRRVHRPDEDAVTLAAQAARDALPADLEKIDALLFVSTTAPYEVGGSGQALAELLNLQGQMFTLDLASSRRDGLAALRLASGLAVDGASVLVCAAHTPLKGPDGSAAVAMLLGRSSAHTSPMATLVSTASTTHELRDRWRLSGHDTDHDADKSFVQRIATRDRLENLLSKAGSGRPVLTGPDARTAATLETSLGGHGDSLLCHTGDLGPVHPLLRLLASLDQQSLVALTSNGLGEAVAVTPGPRGAEYSGALLAAIKSPQSTREAPVDTTIPADFDPYSSGPRSWRDRAADFRLEGLVGSPGSTWTPPARLAARGVVIATTIDHIYPGADQPTGMAVVQMEEGGQFYGQVAMGEQVTIGQRTELVPRVLHRGGGSVQYFWKVLPCR